MKPKLFLIPVTLSDTNPKEVLPESVFKIIYSLDEFIVENIRSARRFLRKTGYTKDFDHEVTFYEIGKHHNSDEIIELLQIDTRTKSLGLLSETGVPCVADPGAGIVKIFHQHGFQVAPLVGPSSIILALMASGFNGQNFAFHGYLPIDRNDFKQKLKQLEKTIIQNNQTQIFIETPFRNNKLLDAIISNCSINLKLCIASNLTTSQEFVISRSISEWRENLPDLNKKPTVFLLYK